MLGKRKKLQWSEINLQFKKRFDMPILLEDQPKKGIYYSFEDFRKNKPNDTSLRFREGNVSDELYVVSGEREQLVSDYWGFFDGSTLFIKAGFSAFKAVKQQNTFEIFGSLYVSNYHDNPTPGGLNINSTSLDRKIMQVNMDTGEFY
jgi:hypothetical protein